MARMNEPRKNWTIERLLRIHTELGIIFPEPRSNGEVDVRLAKVLEINKDEAVISQPGPPVLKSQTGLEVTCTFVHTDLMDGSYVRLGWDSRVLKVDRQFVLEGGDGSGEPEAIVIIDIPSGCELRKVNCRQDYRVPIEDRSVNMQLKFSREPVEVIDISNGGAMIRFPLPVSDLPPVLSEGASVKFKLCPPKEIQSAALDGEACVVRVCRGGRSAESYLGLKFMDMNSLNLRNLGRVVTHYMRLESQKRAGVE